MGCRSRRRRVGLGNGQGRSGEAGAGAPPAVGGGGKRFGRRQRRRRGRLPPPDLAVLLSESDRHYCACTLAIPESVHFSSKTKPFLFGKSNQKQLETGKTRRASSAVRSATDGPDRRGTVTRTSRSSGRRLSLPPRRHRPLPPHPPSTPRGALHQEEDKPLLVKPSRAAAARRGRRSFMERLAAFTALAAASLVLQELAALPLSPPPDGVVQCAFLTAQLAAHL